MVRYAGPKADRCESVPDLTLARRLFLWGDIKSWSTTPPTILCASLDFAVAMAGLLAHTVDKVLQRDEAYVRRSDMMI